MNPTSTVFDDHMQLHNDVHPEQQLNVQSCSSSSKIVYLKEGSGCCSVLSLLNTLPSILILMSAYVFGRAAAFAFLP